MNHLYNEAEGPTPRLKRLWARVQKSRLHRHVAYGLGARALSALVTYLLLRAGWPTMIAEIVALVSMLYVFAALYELQHRENVE
jgi:hypothetical protein